MHITVDRDRCIAAGSCAAVAPAIFDQGDEDGVVVVLQREPAAEEHDAVRLAASMCPSAVITVEE
ncbi:ferredoxin [Gordonia sp. LSe1-13]|uniref:Ferredoxin n=1 Tax=Gordonia sesuvii TaxID=3116777 RepID=A0ABU7M978_9ACTN|nr:ferredoxin [Gordonia sp. LSe1-13]